MEDDEPGSFSAESMTTEDSSDDVRNTANAMNDSCNIGIDPLMIQEGVVENVVLTSMVVEAEEDEQDRAGGDHSGVVSSEMAATFDLVNQFPNEVAASGDGIIVKAEQEEEMGTSTEDAMMMVKEEEQEEEGGIIDIGVRQEEEEQQQQHQIAIVAATTEEQQQGMPQQFIILARTGDDGIAQTDVVPEIVAQRYIQVEGNDGQTYFLAVTDEDAAKIITEPVKSSIPSQQIVPSKVVKSGRKTAISSTSAVSFSTSSASISSLSPAQPPSSSPSSSSSSSNRAKVSNTESINQAWFTTRDDKNALHKEGHQWKQGQWTKEEVDILKSNIENYCKDHGIKDAAEVVFEMSKDERKDFYRTIALGIQRPLFSVYRRVTRMYDRKNHRGKYTPTEMKSLRGLRAQHGNDWAAIGQALGRSASSVKDKCRLMKDNCNSGKWYPDEETRLAAAVHKLTGVKPSESITTGLSWASVAEHVGTRSEKQCRTKWLNYLNWKQQGGADWTREDDGILIVKVSQLNVHNDSEIDWNVLSKDWSSVRSPQWLRGKWWALKRHISDYNKLSYPELLANMKKALSWSLKPKNGVRPVKMDIMDQQNLAGGTSGFLKNCYPVSITSDAEGNGVFLSHCPLDDEGYQYEVLQQWSPQVITQVTQQNSSTMEGAQVVNSTPAGHIIVQTITGLTTENMSVSGDHHHQQQPVIISAGDLGGSGGLGGSGDVEQDKTDSGNTSDTAMTLHLSDNAVSQSEQEIGVLTDSDNLHDATGIAMNFDPGEGQEIIAVSEYTNQSDVSGGDHMMSHHNVFETVTSQSNGHLGMGVASSPTRPNSLMTSLKDPILMSSSSDVECEKHQNTLTGEHTEMIG